MKCMQKNLTLTNAQRKVLDREIRDELSKLIQSFEDDFDIVFAYTLNKHFGFGKKRIKRFYQAALSDRVELSRFYCDDDKTDARIDIFAIATRRVNECEKFFRSPWGNFLTYGYGEQLIKILREKVGVEDDN